MSQTIKTSAVLYLGAREDDRNAMVCQEPPVCILARGVYNVHAEGLDQWGVRSVFARGENGFKQSR